MPDRRDLLLHARPNDTSVSNSRGKQVPLEGNGISAAGPSLFIPSAQSVDNLVRERRLSVMRL